VQKTYLVKVAGVSPEESLNKLRKGVVLQSVKPKAGDKRSPEKVRTAPAKITVFKEGDNPWYEVTIIEGRNRQIRRMFEEIGHHVEKIKRVKYGPLELDVEPGKYRPLDEREVARLKKAVQSRRKAS
jgi:23S rRNA pseudouridine2605 synthase